MSWFGKRELITFGSNVIEKNLLEPRRCRVVFNTLVCSPMLVLEDQQPLLLMQGPQGEVKRRIAAGLLPPKQLVIVLCGALFHAT